MRYLTQGWHLLGSRESASILKCLVSIWLKGAVRVEERGGGGEAERETHDWREHTERLWGPRSLGSCVELPSYLKVQQFSNVFRECPPIQRCVLQMPNPHTDGVSSLETRNKQRSHSICGFLKLSLGQKCRAVRTGPWKNSGSRGEGGNQSQPCPSVDQSIEDVPVSHLVFRNSTVTSVSLRFIGRIVFHFVSFTMSRIALPLWIKQQAVFSSSLFPMIQRGPGQMRTNELVSKLKGQRGTKSLSNGGKWYFNRVFRKANLMPKILNKQNTPRSDGCL